MIDFAQARRMMVEGQIRTADVTDLPLLAAMLDVQRERFVPPDRVDLAYVDLDLPAGTARGPNTRRMLRPMVLAKLLQAAEVVPGNRVLDVASGTGYTAAVLSAIGAQVVALEEDEALAGTARQVLAEFAPEVTVVSGPLTAGWPSAGPYDVILIEGATEIPPREFFPQLGDRGRLLCIEGRTPGKAVLYRRVEDDVSGRPIFDAAATLLPGFIAPPAFVF